MGSVQTKTGQQVLHTPAGCTAIAEQHHGNVIRGAVSSLYTHRHRACLHIAMPPCVAHTTHRQLACRGRT